MIAFACPRCQTAHRVADDQAGQKIRCQCGAGVRVPVRGGVAPPVVPVQPPPRPVPYQPSPVNYPPPAPPPVSYAPPPVVHAPTAFPPVPYPDTDRAATPGYLQSGSVLSQMWYYELAGWPTGPVGEPELQALAAGRTLDGATRVWCEGMAQWEPAAVALPGVFPHVPTRAPVWQVVVTAVLVGLAVLSVILLVVVAVRTRAKRAATAPAAVEVGRGAHAVGHPGWGAYR